MSLQRILITQLVYKRSSMSSQVKVNFHMLPHRCFVYSNLKRNDFRGGLSLDAATTARCFCLLDGHPVLAFSLTFPPANSLCSHINMLISSVASWVNQVWKTLRISTIPLSYQCGVSREPMDWLLAGLHCCNYWCLPFYVAKFTLLNLKWEHTHTHKKI